MQGQRVGGSGCSPNRNVPPRGKRISQKGGRLADGKVTTLPSPPRSSLNSAFVKSRHISQPRPFTVSTSGRTASILPSRTTETTFPPPPTRRTSADLFLSWLQNNRKSVTDDERIFVLAARSFGATTALRLAKRFQWQCKRPRKELRELFSSKRGASYASTQ